MSFNQQLNPNKTFHKIYSRPLSIHVESLRCLTLIAELFRRNRHKQRLMVDIKTVISSKHRLRLLDSIKSMVITIKTTDLKRHQLYPTETHENRRQSTILPMKRFVWELNAPSLEDVM